ncbi:MAG: AfsR/SARP family transcriptional regulator, partial [Candidatus Dormibacteraceae bacterium]
HARLEARQGWASTSQALFAAHFSGALSETELLGQLQYRALPLPAEKAIAPKFQPRPAMSIQWWLDHQVTKIVSDVAPSATGDGARPLDEAAPALEPDPPPLLVQRRSPLGPTYLAINTLGRIELRQGEEDFGPELLGRPVVAFLWLYLLIRALTGPRDRLMRVDIANELTPGMPADKQRTRLRNRLSDMMRKLPKPLAERMVVDHDESVKLDLSRCSIDLLRLEAIAAECTAKDGILSPDLAAEAAALLDTTAGEFLPGWEQLENEVNGGRGSAGELVAQLRQRAESARISVMGALAANHLARREPARAVPLLEQALERQPDREDLARKLRAAYLETGQLGRAADLQRLHGFQG